MADGSTFVPRAGIDYPRDLTEFHEFFHTEESCRRYLKKVRWRDGFRCPACGRGGNPWNARRDVLLCPHCRFESRLTAGTVFEGTRKPLRLWFLAMWELTSQKYGANALGLQRVLGLGSYMTAWAWLHKLRRAMVRPGRDRLHGRVEVDESFVGGEETGTAQRGRGAATKALVAIAAEEDGRGIGRVRMARIPSATRRCLHEFLQQAVEPGSVVHTDGLPAYAGMEAFGYAHDPTVLLGKGKDAA